MVLFLFCCCLSLCLLSSNFPVVLLLLYVCWPQNKKKMFGLSFSWYYILAKTKQKKHRLIFIGIWQKWFGQVVSYFLCLAEITCTCHIVKKAKRNGFLFWVFFFYKNILVLDVKVFYIK